ncbi:MAG: HAD family phosphatase [Treponema sp.]|jgi:HAD superfamily hydrolase (TIGR01509 family)|nr:HAD family phosphatase [Treponema sp.]
MITHTLRPAGVIFDMDGLMLDTERPMVELWIQIAQAQGWDITPERMFRTVGVNEAATRAVCMEEWGPDFPYDVIREEAIQAMLETVEQQGIQHRPGLITLLDHLGSLRIPLGLATSTAREIALWKLKKAHILERFEAFACGDEVIRGKPEPDIFLLAAERLGKEPQDCVGFEDSPAGLQGLHAAGIRSVFIKDLIEPPPDILTMVWCRCADLAEAVALF